MNSVTTDKIIALLNSTSSTTIASYTHYQVVSSEIWLGLAGLFVLLAVACGFGVWYAIAKEEGEVGGVCLVIGVLLLLVAGLITADNLSSLLSPRACAIHQLISDIRGGH